MEDDNTADPNSVRVLANDWEVLLARLLLRVCDTVADSDRDQEFLDLYNSLKPLAEKTLRKGHRRRELPLKGVRHGNS